MYRFAISLRARQLDEVSYFEVLSRTSITHRLTVASSSLAIESNCVSLEQAVASSDIVSANIGAVLIIVTSMTKISLSRNEGDCPPFPCVRDPRNGMKQEPANAKCGHVYRKLAITEWLEPMEKTEGHAKLENELRHRLQLERPRIIRQLAEARTDDSDLAKNAEYHATKQVQEQNESRIAELEEKLARAEVIDISKLSGDTVKFGATVTLIDQDIGEQKVWQIVGEPEADAKKGTISITSPLARALIGKRTGANAEVATPAGIKAYRIEKVDWR
jgi:transcription elongation factor GreA